MAIAEAVKEAIWLKGLVEDLCLHQGVTMMFCDSQSVIHLTKHQMYHERTKHIDIRYHFIREIKVIKVKKIGTADNPADMMTKPVPYASSSTVSIYLVFKVTKVQPIWVKKRQQGSKKYLIQFKLKWRSLLCIQVKVEIC